jgi:thioredoxin 1
MNGERIKSEDEFIDMLNGSSPSVLLFFADWDSDSKQVEPEIEYFIENRDMLYMRVDVDEFERLAVRNNITDIPTVVFGKNGDIVAKETGVLTEEDIEALYNQIN